MDMKEKVQVVNKGSKTYREYFNEKHVEIPAGKSIEMVRHLAIKFLKNINPTTDPETGMPVEKNLEIEEIREKINRKQG